jgi:phage/plasmid-like protein (TIGR03299 family)
MAHKIESVAYLGAKPWHGLGVEIKDGFISPAEMMKVAGLDWRVNLEDAFLADGTKIPKVKIPRRDSDNAILGNVGERYHVLQNEEAFDWFKPFIDTREASFETAGSLRGGKIVWALAKANIPTVEIVKGDPVESYILLSHSHDGTLSIRSGFSATRVVCANTLSQAINSSSSKLLKLKHTRNAVLALEKVREVMDVARKDFIATTEQYKFLASKAINKKDLEKYVTRIFKTEDSESELRQSTVEKIEYLFENGKGNQFGRGTAWNAMNAVTEYLTHEKGRTVDNRLHSLWFGLDVATNQKALELATKLAEGTLE